MDVQLKQDFLRKKEMLERRLAKRRLKVRQTEAELTLIDRILEKDEDLMRFKAELEQKRTEGIRTRASD